MARAKISVEGPLHPEAQKTRAMGARYREMIAANQDEAAVSKARKTAERVKLSGEQTAREAELIALAANEDPTIAQFGAEQLAEFRAGNKVEEPTVAEKPGVIKELKERMLKYSETEATRRERKTEEVVDFVALCEARDGGWSTVELRAFGPYIDRAVLGGKMTELALQQFAKSPEVLPESVRSSIQAKIDLAVQQEIEARTAKISLTDAAMREKLLEKMRLDANSVEKQQANFAALVEAAKSGDFKIDLSTPRAAAVVIREAMLGQGKLSVDEVINIMATFESSAQAKIDDATREEMWKLASKAEWAMSEDDQKRKQELNKMYKGSDGVRARDEFALGVKVANELRTLEQAIKRAENLPDVLQEILKSGEEKARGMIDSQIAWYEKDIVAKNLELENLAEQAKVGGHKVSSWASGSDEEVVARGKYDVIAVIELEGVRSRLEALVTELKQKPDLEQRQIFDDSQAEASRLREQVTRELQREREKELIFVSFDRHYLRPAAGQEKTKLAARVITRNLESGSSKFDVSYISREGESKVEGEFRSKRREVEAGRAGLLKKVEDELYNVSKILRPAYFTDGWYRAANAMRLKANENYAKAFEKRTTAHDKLYRLEGTSKSFFEFVTGARQAEITKLKKEIDERDKAVKDAEQASAEVTIKYNQLFNYVNALHHK